MKVESLIHIAFFVLLYSRFKFQHHARGEGKFFKPLRVTEPNVISHNLPIAFEPLNNQKLTTKLIKQFSIDPKKVWKTDHLKFLKDKSVWSVIAVDPGSYIIETKESGSTVIFESKAEYSVTEVMPINIEINKKPVLLATVSINDTDWMWSTLLVYRAGWYEVMKTGRIEP